MEREVVGCYDGGQHGGLSLAALAWVDLFPLALRLGHDAVVSAFAQGPVAPVRSQHEAAEDAGRDNEHDAGSESYEGEGGGENQRDGDEYADGQRSTGMFLIQIRKRDTAQRREWKKIAQKRISKRDIACANMI